MQALKIRLLRFCSSFRIPGIAVLCLLFISIGFGQPNPTDKVVTLIKSFKVRVRATPEILPDNILSSLFKGTQLPMTGEENGWYRVTLPDGQTGWVYGDYGKVEKARDQLEVVYEVVKVRARPDTNSDSVARTIMGQRIHLLDKTNGWYKIQIPDETEGWVREDMVTLRPAFAKEQETSSPVVPDPGTQNGPGIAAPDEAAPPQVTQANSSLETADSEDTQDSPNPKAGATSPAKTVLTPSPSSPAASSDQSDILTEIGIDWLTLTFVTAFLTLLAIVIFTLFRRRRLTNLSQAIEKGRSKTNELERTLIREMKDAQKKLSSLDIEAQNRLQNFRDLAGDSAELSSKTSEDMLTSLEELRAVIENQQKRMDLYSELVRLQNEQIDAYKQENASVKKLLELKDES